MQALEANGAERQKQVEIEAGAKKATVVAEEEGKEREMGQEQNEKEEQEDQEEEVQAAAASGGDPAGGVAAARVPTTEQASTTEGQSNPTLEVVAITKIQARCRRIITRQFIVQVQLCLTHAFYDRHFDLVSFLSRPC
jgi:hypothetical protein